jgi:hypothetical protein
MAEVTLEQMKQLLEGKTVRVGYTHKSTYHLEGPCTEVYPIGEFPNFFGLRVGDGPSPIFQGISPSQVNAEEVIGFTGHRSGVGLEIRIVVESTQKVKQMVDDVLVEQLSVGDEVYVGCALLAGIHSTKIVEIRPRPKNDRPLCMNDFKENDGLMYVLANGKEVPRVCLRLKK